MDWLWFSLSSVLLFALANVIDKGLLTHRVKNPYLPVIVDMFLGLIFAGAVVVLVGISPVSTPAILAMLGLGAIYLGILASYFKAMQLEEVSRVIPLYNLDVFFVLVFSIVFLGKIFEFSQIAGILALLGGGLLISQHDFSKIKFGKAALFVLVGAIGLSIYFTVSDYLLQGVDVATFFVYMRMGAFVAALPLVWIHRRDVRAMMTQPVKYGLGIIILSESITVISTFLGSSGIQQSSGAFHSAISAAQPVFVFLLATGVSIFFPRLLQEEVKGATLLQKGIAILLIFI
ncbi:MAG: EamA family transporter [archaeon]